MHGEMSLCIKQAFYRKRNTSTEHTPQEENPISSHMRGHSSTHPNIRESDGTSCKLHRGRICFHRRHVFIGNNIYSGPRVCFILPRTKPLR